MFTTAGWLGLKSAVDDILDGEVQKALRTFFGANLFDPILAAVLKRRGAATADPQTVVIIPGVLGTHLLDHGGPGAPRRLWLDLRDPGAVRDLRMTPGLTDEEDRDAVAGVDVRTGELLVEGYGLLSIYLRHVWGMNVVPFPYDWRRSIDVNARRLRAVLAAGPVSVVAHSMGGLVLRRCVQLDPTVLGQLDHAVCMATPNLGSYVPLDVASGSYWLGRLFGVAAGSPGASVLATCPGFLQLLPESATPEMARLLHEPMTWPRPALHAALMPRARSFTHSLRDPASAEVRDADLELRRRTSVILGDNLLTPDRVEWRHDRPSFPARGLGDLMVPRDSAWDGHAMGNYGSLWPHPFIGQDPDVVTGIASLLRTRGQDPGPLRSVDGASRGLESVERRSRPPEHEQEPAGFAARRQAGLLDNQDLHWLFASAASRPAADL